MNAERGTSDDRTHRDNTNLLLVYGTLLPGETRWHYLAPWVTDNGQPDQIDGDLYDTGLGYPALIIADDARYRGGTTVGRVFTIGTHASDSHAHLTTVLDELDLVEGAVGGLYRRVVATTAAGRRVWVYAYGHGLELTPIPSGNWLAHRGAVSATAPNPISNPE